MFFKTQTIAETLSHFVCVIYRPTGNYRVLHVCANPPPKNQHKYKNKHAIHNP